MHVYFTFSPTCIGSYRAIFRAYNYIGLQLLYSPLKAYARFNVELKMLKSLCKTL